MQKKVIIALLMAIIAGSCGLLYLRDKNPANTETAAVAETSIENNTSDTASTGSDSEDESDAVESDTEKFIEQYESYNLTSYLSNNRSKLHRSVTLNHDADISYISYKDAIQKFNNRDSFVLYYGWPTCPYCRALVEPFLNAAANTNTKIYVIELPDEDYETSRTNYEWKDGEVVTTNTNDDYEEFIEALGGNDTFTEKIVYKDDDDTEGVDTGKATMYAPTILLIKDKKATLYSEDDWKNVEASQDTTGKPDSEIALENAIKSISES